jgi:hypothetical protein
MELINQKKIYIFVNICIYLTYNLIIFMNYLLIFLLLIIKCFIVFYSYSFLWSASDTKNYKNTLFVMPLYLITFNKI